MLGMVVMILSACSSQPEASPDQVNLQLKWVHQAQFAGFYVAETQGFFKEENIEVTFIQVASTLIYLMASSVLLHSKNRVLPPPMIL